MKRKLNQADLWLIDEITNELQRRFRISLDKAKECVRNSNLIPMLYSDQEFVHHEDLHLWIRVIVQQNKLIDPDKIRLALLAGGSVKTKHHIDAQLICREVRGKE
ncbi:hypothetical protein [Brevibacillus borstelensis]|uniref:hypothetical protein n=1 Tax=Brevibacillus borstelensis TaxID=45462 RepID=UPI001D0AC4AF|nr:hypothetical protein [Brevibacillus borstelensis]MCC0566274.1 hypothetical protein [Brevibacillus borstelensis]